MRVAAQLELVNNLSGSLNRAQITCSLEPFESGYTDKAGTLASGSLSETQIANKSSSVGYR